MTISITNVSYITYADADNPNGYPSTWIADSIEDADPAPSSPWVTVSLSAFNALIATQRSEYETMREATAEIEGDDPQGPSNVVEWSEEWISSTIAGRMNWASVTSGTAAATSMNTSIQETDSVGIVELNTGTDTTGYACLHLNPDSVCLGGGIIQLTARIMPSDLADGTNKWIGKVGLGDDTSGSGHVDELTVGFDYDLYGGNWYLKLTNGATAATTTVDLGVAPVADQWTKISILISAYATAIKVYIDGSLCTTYTNATYIPIGSGRSFGPYVAATKAAGTSARTLYADYFAMRSRFNSQR